MPIDSFDEVQELAQLLHGDGGTALKLDLDQLFVGNRIEAVGCGDRCRDAFKLDLLGGIGAACQKLPGCIPLLAGLGEADIGIDAERQRLLLAEIAIVHAPIASAIGSGVEK